MSDDWAQSAAQQIRNQLVGGGRRLTQKRVDAAARLAREAYRKGAEDMRERAAVKVGKVNDFLANAVRALPTLGEEEKR